MAIHKGHEFSIQIPPNGSEQSTEAEAFPVSMDLLPEAALVFALDGTILKANPPALELFEASEAEVIGRNLYSMGLMEPEKARDRVAHLTSGATIRFEMDFLTFKGNR